MPLINRIARVVPVAAFLLSIVGMTAIAFGRDQIETKRAGRPAQFPTYMEVLDYESSPPATIAGMLRIEWHAHEALTHTREPGGFVRVPLVPAGWQPGDPVDVVVEFPRVAVTDLAAWLEQCRKDAATRPQTEVTGYLLPLTQGQFHAWFPKLRSAEKVQILYVSRPEEIEAVRSTWTASTTLIPVAILIAFVVIVWRSYKSSASSATGPSTPMKLWAKLSQFHPHAAIVLSLYLGIRLYGAATIYSDVANAPDPLPVDEWNARREEQGETVIDGRVLVDAVGFQRNFVSSRGRNWAPSSVRVFVPLVGPDWHPGDPVRAVWMSSLPIDRAVAWHRELTARPDREADVSVFPLSVETFRTTIPGLQPARGPVGLQPTAKSSLPGAIPNWTDWVLIAALGALVAVGAHVRRSSGIHL